MNLRDHWLHDSGGLVWHWRALRRRHTLWRPFRNQVALWLAAWQPPEKALLLVGPSAGYTLDGAFLARWSSIIALEPDPLARYLLRRRCGERLQFADLDVFAPQGMQALAAHYPGHAILFSNVLGQLAPRQPDAARRWYAALRTALAQQHWASYHDLVSTARRPDGVACQDLDGESLEALMARFWHGGEVAITDHCSFGLGLDAAAASALWKHRAVAHWALGPAQHHLVEFLQYEPTQT